MKIFAILLLISYGALGQSGADERCSVAGKVINSVSKEPVQAHIVYESLPYGTSMGFLHGDTFSFSVEKEISYRLKAEAAGYAPYTSIIDPDEFQDGRYRVNINLIPTGVNQLIRLEKLIFGLGEANITRESYQELDKIVEMMKDNPGMKIQLEGHTDFRGNVRQNLRLSEDRVKAVRKYLIARGIHKRRIKTKAFGGAQPLSRDDDRKARERNRRVEVRILSE